MGIEQLGRSLGLENALSFFRDFHFLETGASHRRSDPATEWRTVAGSTANSWIRSIPLTSPNWPLDSTDLPGNGVSNGVRDQFLLPQLEFLYSRLSLLSKLWTEHCVRLLDPRCRH